MLFKIIPFILSVICVFVKGSYADVSCKIATTAMAKASQIRGLAAKKTVPCEIHNQEEVRTFLIDAIKTRIPPEKLKSDELIYKAIGFLPDDFDYVQGMINLYVSQLGGYYDPEKHHYVMAGWIPEIMQTAVAVHELTHALQDQYFNLKDFTDDSKFTTDEILARQALVEGDATAVMTDYALLAQGKSLKDQKDVEAMVLQNVIGLGFMGGNAPNSVKLSLLFPYASGLRFVHSFLRKGGYKAIDGLYKNPPKSTMEILHPEKYTGKIETSTNDKEDRISPDIKGEDIKTDVIGEFVISTILSECINGQIAAEAAAGWKSDKVFLRNDPDSNKSSVIWRTIWQSSEDAQKFFDTYSICISKKFNHPVIRNTWTNMSDVKIKIEKNNNEVIWTHCQL